jgi:hypothetical protein
MASEDDYAWWLADDPSRAPRPRAVVERDMLRAAAKALRSRSGASRYREGELIADVGNSVAALIDAVRVLAAAAADGATHTVLPDTEVARWNSAMAGVRDGFLAEHPALAERLRGAGLLTGS